MGFWDKLGKATTSAVKSKASDMNAARQRASSLSDAQLRKEAEGTGSSWQARLRKAAAKSN